MAATLVEGREYGLASNVSTSGNKTFIHFKLTDSALRALEEFSKIKGRCNRKPTIQFTDGNGVMCIPGQVSSDDPKAERKFTLNLSKIHGDANGSFDCVRQISRPQGSSFQCLGSMQFKITTIANNDVYTDTRKKITIAETESKKFCAKEIKMSGRFSGKKMKKVIPSNQYKASNPAKPTSLPLSRPSLTSLPNSSSSIHSSVSAVSRPTPPSTNSLSSHQAPNSSWGSSKPLSSGNNILRTGVHSASKPTSGIIDKPYKDRVIHLLALRPYKKPELIARLMKDGIREKDKNMLGETLNAVAMMNKDNSYGLSKSSWKLVNPDWEFYTDVDKQLLKRNQQQIESRLSISPSVSPPVRSSGSQSPAQKRGSEEPVDAVPSKKQRISHQEKPQSHTSSSVAATNKDIQDSSPGYHPSPGYNFVDSGYGAGASSPDAGSPGSTGSNRENQAKGNGADPSQPDYLSQYNKIRSCEQRLRYKEDFNMQYKEYLQLHQKVNNVSNKFAELQESIKKLDEDSQEFQELKSRVLKEYEAQKMNEKFFEQRDRVRYLHAKLGHIKRLIMDYDTHQHAQECS